MTTGSMPAGRRGARRALVALAAALVAATLAVLVLPVAACARSYSISRVDIDATLDADGALTVVEERTFSFDGSFNGVYWNIPVEDADGGEMDVSILSAGFCQGGTLRELACGDYSDAYGHYTVSTVTSDSGTECAQLKIYRSAEDEDVTFRICYRVEGSASAWSDCGELYWKFVSDGWDVPSEDVTLTLHLPVPSGESVDAGDNVLMWAHGPLDGEVEADGDDIVATVPSVDTSSFAEIRVAFPTDWLSGVVPSSSARLDAIKAEEQQWAEEADRSRMLARVLIAAGVVVPGGLAVLLVLRYLKARKAYRAAHTPQFQGDYFRDVPTADHPAVLGSLYEAGEVPSRLLAATLMRLTDERVVGLDQVTTTKKRLLGTKEETDYRLTYDHDRATELGDEVDRQAARILFEKIWYKAGQERDSAGRPVLMFSDLDRVATDEPEYYSDVMKEWEETIEDKCRERSFFVDKSNKAARDLVPLAVVCIVLGAIACPLGAELGAWPVVACGVLAVAAAVVVLVLTRRFDDISPEGVEIRAKLEALRRWLLEFTALDEAVPTDVVLWNRLLVMAVALDVAEEVIRQLEVAVPQVLADPRLTTAYTWYHVGHGTRSPMSSFDDHCRDAGHISAAALAASAASSDGGGGGFSGGGGGGFGGGGGGGAF